MLDPIERVDQQDRAARGEPVVQFAVRFVGSERGAFLQHDVTGVHPRVHQDDRYPRFGAAIGDRRLQRGRAAVQRQQRRMHVERAEPRNVEQSLRDDLAVRCDDERVRRERSRLVDERLEAFGRIDAQAVRLRCALHRRRDEFVAAAGGPVRLRHDADDVVPLRHPLEDRNGELARSENDDLQRAPAATASASATSSSVCALRTFFALSM